MTDWLNQMAGPTFAQAILWLLAALLLLVVLLLVVRLIRSMTFGTFVAGGRNRKARLAVMDATAVDSHRRLVLVRRDDVEHLLLIGGPTDVVVERDIRLIASRRQPVPPEGHPAPAPRPQPPQAPPGRPQPSPAPRQAAMPSPAPPRQAAPAREAAPAPARSAPPRQPPPPDAIDDALLHELEASLEEPEPHLPARPAEAGRPASPDDEMTRLLGELSPGHKR